MVDARRQRFRAVAHAAEDAKPDPPLARSGRRQTIPIPAQRATAFAVGLRGAGGEAQGRARRLLSMARAIASGIGGRSGHRCGEALNRPAARCVIFCAGCVHSPG
jgi:hypothetical protein